ncbi:SRPBCC family protein [Tengunoibacter tsumagoiensis]|uniref:Polyketide cyclase n=1 Tax=Tengunoibacter tsumagoiensis TaxID=2014871 RepID=A0A401ZW25_9CHLR|nr:SRPBCC family protein [Tengunoibacter tsumagoiensis]GCE10992.1 polyketide cyclase [Tengunoibacter tsumagoiensis]
MGTIYIEASELIPASVEKVYAFMIDYQAGHPTILPRQFGPIVIEKGGIGAGTIFRSSFKTFGRELPIHMEVSEPEPGRVFIEKSLDATSSLQTFFIFEPASKGNATQLTISTEQEGHAGPLGWLEKKVIPPLLKRVYQQELKLIVDTFKAQQL